MANCEKCGKPVGDKHYILDITEQSDRVMCDEFACDLCRTCVEMVINMVCGINNEKGE